MSQEFLNTRYIQVDFKSQSGFKPLFDHLDQDPATPSIFYLAVGPDVISTIKERFCEQEECHIVKYEKAIIATEKPFGVDSRLAIELNRELQEIAREDQIYRIDHYLLKDTVMRILEYRHAQQLFGAKFWEGLKRIDIIASESNTIGSRAKYYDKHGGAINDWIQSHLLQVMALAITDKQTGDFNSIRAEAIESANPVVGSLKTGQYGGYLDTEGIHKGSTTETYASIQLHSDLQHLPDIPIVISTGKALKEKHVHIKYHLESSSAITLEIDSNGRESVLGSNQHDAYYNVLLALLHERPENFVSLREITAQWRIADKLNEEKAKHKPFTYTPGTAITDLP